MSKCSKNRAVSKTLAAMATTLTIGAITPVASANGLTGPQVRAIVRQEVAKIPRIVGPRGPVGAMGTTGAQGLPGATGPAGMDGFPSLFAFVNGVGTPLVNIGLSSGISEANVRIESIEESGGKRHTRYCFSGLPPVSGGQVTLDGNGFTNDVPTAYLNFFNGDPTCLPEVRVSVPKATSAQSGFFILLY